MDGGDKTTESFMWVEDYSETGYGWNPHPPQQTPLTRKRKKMEFVGWASRALIHFLESIGRDVTRPISQFDVTAIVNDYVDKNLVNPTNNHYYLFNTLTLKNNKENNNKNKNKKKNKKRVVCDDRLRALFGKKSISRVMIYKLLEPHLAASNESGDSEDDDIGYLSWGANEEHKEPKGKHEKRPYRFPVGEFCNANPLPKSCFAALIPENIRLVYLKRSVMHNILKQEVEPKTLETKLVGTFVRTKSDPNDYRQKHSHNLLQVTGLKSSSGTDGNNTEFLLQVSGVIKDIPVCLLSDEDFSKEECEDLRQRVKDGMLKRPQVEELQHRARLLHEDITKHWLARELALLQNLIDRANEKGWRRELFEYLERKELLETPEEQSRLLRERPTIIAEEIEVEATPCPDEIKQTNSDCLGPIIERPTEAAASDTGDDEFELTWALDIEESEHNGSMQEVQQEPTESVNENHGESETQKVNITESKPLQGIMEQQVIDLSDNENCGGESEPQRVSVTESKALQGTMEQQVIDLSDDEEDAEAAQKEQASDDSDDLIWHYMDPQGDVQGPFAVTSLKRWSDADYFPPEFKIWKTGQSPTEAVYLEDILNREFPN